MKRVDENYAREAISSGNRILVDFFADWCGPCNRVSPILEEVSAEFPSIEFIKVNVDECAEFAAEMNISSIPAIIVFDGGEEKKRICGAQSKTFIKDMLENI